MTSITLDDMQSDLRTWFSRVRDGETLIVVEADRPLAEIRPIPGDDATLRPYALCAGEFTVPDDFDEPLSEDVLGLFEGGG
jgi:antitoxin (DNA-binding transcriptional repressor) of toxin-antitoxin stability system